MDGMHLNEKWKGNSLINLSRKVTSVFSMLYKRKILRPYHFISLCSTVNIERIMQVIIYFKNFSFLISIIKMFWYLLYISNLDCYISQMIWTYITISVSDIKKASFVHVHVLTVCYSRCYRYLSYMIWCFACNVYQISVFIKNIGIPTYTIDSTQLYA